MDNFLLLKLNRSIWVSLLEEGRVLDAISYFETYRNNLMMLKNDKTFQHQVQDELMMSLGLFLGKMNKLAKEYMKETNYSDALICYTSIFKYDQYDVYNLRDYIQCLNELQQFDLAKELIYHLEQIVPADSEVYKLLSEIYSRNNEIQKAVENYEKYLELKGSSKITASEYNQLGCYYNILYSDLTAQYSDVKKSLECFEKAVQMEPFNRLFYKNATIMASKANDKTKTRIFWDKLIELDELTNDDKYDYAAFCIKTENYEDWYKYFDARFLKENNKTAYPKISQPKWNGVKDISNSVLLVHYEQGYGDTFLMWGYMPRLVKLAKHVIFVVQDSVYELLKENDFGVEVIPRSLFNQNKVKFDYHIPSMSIPIALRLKRENISAGGGYIKPDDKLVAEYKEKYFNNEKFKIGISFSGSAAGNQTRNIPLKDLLVLDKLKNVEIYSLTKDVEDEQFKIFTNNKIHNIAADFNNFNQTAAAIANLDVVITTDNCILNLAGALGKRTFALFNWHYEFRWFDLSGDNVVWLTSVKPFVNDKMNNWSYSVSRAVDEIKKIMNS